MALFHYKFHNKKCENIWPRLQSLLYKDNKDLYMIIVMQIAIFFFISEVFSFAMHFNKYAAISNKLAISMHFPYCRNTLGSNKNKV